MTWQRRVLAGVGVFVVVVLLVPLLWWQFLGPDRFRGLELGTDPNTTIAADDFDEVPFAVIPITPTDEGSEAEVEQAPVIELPPLTMSDTTTVTVIFSVGSFGMTREEAERLNVADLGDRGTDKLTDSIMVLISDRPTRRAALLSIPRDLWLSHRGHRINATFAARGAQAFVDDVSRVAGVPVHHLVQANFTAFADLVDGIGGVTVQVPQPMADLHSFLYVPEAGCWRLDGPAALAYARSRQALTTRDGGETWRLASGANDFSRIARQQSLVAAAWDQMRGPRLVRNLPDLIKLADGLTIDAGLGIDDVVDLARAFQDVSAGRVEGYTLPTFDRRVGRAAVLGISYSRAMPMYERLRSWPPVAAPAPEPSPSGSEGSAGSEAASDGPSDGASPEPDGSASPSPSSAPTPSGDSAPKNTIASSGCSRSNAFELPEPKPYLYAIEQGERPPDYDPRPAPAREDDDPEGDASDEPGEDPSSTSTDGEPDDEPTDDGGLPSELPTPPAEDEPSDDGSEGPDA